MLLCFTACGNKADSNETDTSQNGAVGSSEGIQSSESELEPKPETEPDPKTTPEYPFYQGCTGAWRADRRGKRKLENLLCHTG